MSISAGQTATPTLVDLQQFDLCLLAYQLHHQSLLWPLDPFYEEWARPGSSRRDNMLAMAHRYVASATSLRGPGASRGWPGNTDLDPILFDYSQVEPWRGALIHDGFSHRFTSLVPSAAATIAEVLVCEYGSHREGRPIDPLFTAERTNPLANPTATDRMYAFEGATGSLDGKPPAWSLLGFVLETHHETGYDVHIAYRGSQSGSGQRAAFQGFVQEKGNPDWVTDMEFLENVTDHRISRHGAVVGGLRDSVITSLGSALRCCEEIAERNGTAPSSISVTGHSLGGALATQFAAAMTIGDIASTLPPELRSWPWPALSLTAFSAPKAGDATFAAAIDAAIPVRRVWAIGDPIVEFPFNEHAGTPVPLTTGRTGTVNHEPAIVRRAIVDQLRWHSPELDSAQLDHQPWQTFDDLGSALQAATDAGVSLEALLPSLDDPSTDSLIELAASVVELPSSYRVPFTKLPAELRRRGRQLRSVFSASADSLDSLHGQLRRFRGIQPGSTVEQYLRQVFVLREAIRNGWTVTDLLDHEGIAHALGTYRRPRPSSNDGSRTGCASSRAPA